MSNLLIFDKFGEARQYLRNMLRLESKLVHSGKWQGFDIRGKPEMAMHEFNHLSYMCPIKTEHLPDLRKSIEPNLPWADDHFEERVGREPLNPGVQWANWPWGHSADKARVHHENGEDRFSHTYMERYWPKQAGSICKEFIDEGFTNSGIRFRYGDLMDVVEHIYHDPLTRQAFLPVWFPEDTGVVFGGRVPCTIGYHFLCRDGKLDITYWIRSCDFKRHYSDDVYLTVRLCIWMLEQLRKRSSRWGSIQPGSLIMHITNLHVFHNDFQELDNAHQ